VKGQRKSRSNSLRRLSEFRHLAMWVHRYIAQAGGIVVDMRGQWNDENGTADTTSPIVGYIVEWEASAVPEPGTALLGLLGVGLVALRFRR
jgi:uncharacterized protein (TIGR03382 family)